MLPEIEICDLGTIGYPEAVAYQEKLFDSIVGQKIRNRKTGNTTLPENYLLLCEHPHVYTLGKNGDPHHLLLNKQQMELQDVTFYRSSRGGDITYHGPGQLVVYPILDLDQFFTDIHKYMRLLEEAVILTLQKYQIEAGRLEGYTGVWLRDGRNLRKICAMGVRCSHWVTMHGLALNISSNLSYFTHIIPCGISDKGVTSIQQELGYAPDAEEVKKTLSFYLQTLFGWNQSGHSSPVMAAATDKNSLFAK